MNDYFAFDEITTKRMPQLLILIIILLLGMPYLGLNLGFNFGIHLKHLKGSSENILLESQIRGYFRQTLFQWAGFSLAAITILLALIRYRLRNDKVALVIGLSVLFSGTIEASHTLCIDGLVLNVHQKNNLDALLWIFSNSISGMILIIGFYIIVKIKPCKKMSRWLFITLTLVPLFAALFIILAFSKQLTLPDMWIHNTKISRPYEIISIVIYLFLLVFQYPKLYKYHSTILAHSILYIGISQIIIALYLMFLSHAPYDSAYNIAYFLKVITYFIPCSCLLIDYVASYTYVLNGQKQIQIKQEELKYIASHDSLTHVFNRSAFEDLLDKSISNAHHTKALIALFIIDLDNFKTINDTFGHIHGDELLKQVSNRLILLKGQGDLLSRVGGDEFTLISPNIQPASSTSSPRKIADRILRELRAPYLIKGKLITVTASIGISLYPADGRNGEQLMIKADLALYKAKSSGKHTYHFYTDGLSTAQYRESELETYLRRALSNDELTLKFQPQYNMMTREVVGAEILLRWENKLLSNPSPDEFISVAEHSGLIIDIGNWVLKKSCQQIALWEKKYGKKLRFSINISPLQLLNKQFVETVIKNINEFQCTPENLEFEITENILMTETNEISEVLNNISLLGIRLSLDDFGKGYSSLKRLKNLPIDTLKIDKDFISDIKNRRDKIIIVDIIIKLANELGMKTIAEGIENKAQIDYLVSKNCYVGQGFLLSKPLSIEDFIKLSYEHNLPK